MIPYLINIPLLILVIWWLRKRTAHYALSFYFYPAIIAKVFAGFTMAWLYLYYFTIGGDTFVIFDYASRFYHLLWEKPDIFFDIVLYNKVYPVEASFIDYEQPRVVFFLKCIMPFHLLTGNQYWLLSAWFSVCSFFSAWFLAEKVLQYFKLNRIATSIAFLFFPSVVFWSSGYCKESIVMACIYSFVGVVLKVIYEKKRQSIFIFIATPLLVYVIWMIKFYYAAILVPVLVAYVLVEKISLLYGFSKDKILLKKVSLFLAVLFFFLFIVALMQDYLHPSYFAEALYNNYKATQVASIGRNVLIFDGFEPTFKSVLKYFTPAMLDGLFRPSFFDAYNLMGYLTAIQNAFLLLAVFVSSYFLIRFQKTFSFPVIVALFYICVLSGFLTLASPNWGTLERYKIAFMPFFVLIVVNGLLQKDKEG